MSTKVDLLPCPHCQGKAEVIRPFRGGDPYVMCVDNYCTSPKATVQAVIDAWNRRDKPKPKRK